MPLPGKFCPVCKAKYDGGEVFCPNDGGRLTTPSQVDGLSAEAVSDPLLGTTLDGRYLVKKRIGEGGMGIVYAGVHVVIDKRVAIKVLREDFSSRADVVERFRQEAKSATRIANQHIVDVADFGETPHGESYFVMEFLDGEDLSRVIAREGTLKVERAARIALQCCDALGSAHDAGIVHRDMKPENVFLVRRGSNDDFVKIVDFGIAKMNDIETPGAPGRKLTKTGMIFGTPEYMSPEQASGKELDHRVDVYAVGVILYEMLSGRVPFVGDTFMGILTQQMFEPPPDMRTVNPNLSCPPEFEAVVMKALAKKPEERFADMRALGDAIRRALGAGAERSSQVGTFVGYGEPVAPAPTKVKEAPVTKASSFPPPPAKALNKGILVGVGAAVGLAIIGTVGLMLMPNGKAAAPEATDTSAKLEDGPQDPGTAPAVPTPVAPGPRRERVSITTNVAAGRLYIDDVEVACDDLRLCTVEVELNRRVTLRVEAEGYESLSTPFEPLVAGTEKKLELVRKRSPRPTGVGGRPVPKPDELKDVPELK